MEALAQASPIRAALLGSACSGNLTSAAKSVRSGSLKSQFNGNISFAKLPSVKTISAPRRVVISAKQQEAAGGYASALLDVAKASDKLDAVHSDIEAFSNLLNSAELSGFLSNPIVGDLQKKNIIQTLARDGNFTEATTSFLNLLVDKKRINIVKDVLAAFEDLYCDITNTQVAVVTSAVKLENSQQALIAKKLQSMTGAMNIKLKNVVDPGLIAGFIVKYGKDGSCLIDMSIKGQLDRLAAQFEFAENA